MYNGPQDPPVGKGFCVALWAAIRTTAIIIIFIVAEVLDDVDKEVCTGTKPDRSSAQNVCGERTLPLYKD